VRVAVYNRHWPTVGGGERYAGAFAQALAGEHEVELLGHEPIDVPLLEERLGLDLSGVTPRVVEDEGSGTLARATSDYDLLVNSSYMSADACGARHGIYVVLFPTPFEGDVSAPKRLAARLLGPAVRRRSASLEWGRGFHLPESLRGRRYRWTSAEATLRVRAPGDGRLPVRLVFGGRPAGVAPAEVEIEVDGRPAAQAVVGHGRRSVPVDLELEARGDAQPALVTIRSGTFVPRDAFGAGDVRELGVRLRSVRVGRGPAATLAAAFPLLAVPPVSLDFLDTYQGLVSISEFSREWVERLWGRESGILYPPVPQREPGEKERLILSVGRFFRREAGHSKKQLELVRAFRRLVRGGLEGWEYHLVGGCSEDHVPYLEQVRREAAGLPVVFHVDASGAELADLYRRAGVFWHAAGLGEDERRRPQRFEHFGITTVEAMSAGAVPIVLGRGGQREIVEHGVSGLHFQTLDELVRRTREVLEDDRLRARLAEGARRRAADFAPERFAAEARRIARETVTTSHGV